MKDYSKRKKSIVNVYLADQTWKKFQELAKHRGQSASGLLGELLDDITGQNDAVQEMRYTLPAKLRHRMGNCTPEERQAGIEACLGLLKPTLGLGRVTPKEMDYYTLVIRCAPPAPNKTLLMNYLGWRMECLRLDGKLDPMTEKDLAMIRGIKPDPEPVNWRPNPEDEPLEMRTDLTREEKDRRILAFMSKD